MLPTEPIVQQLLNSLHAKARSICNEPHAIYRDRLDQEYCTSHLKNAFIMYLADFGPLQQEIHIQ